MPVEIRVPALGESIVDATIVQWLKQPGEYIDRSEPVVELETDKVNVEVPADQAGTLEEILHAEGETVEVGDLLGTIVEGAAPAKTAEEPAAEPAAEAEAPAPAAAEPASVPEPEPVAAGGHRAGPEVRRLAAERGVDLAAVTGSGPGGRILPNDVKGAEAAPPPSAPAPAPTAPAPAPAAGMSPNGHEGREERVRLSRRRLTIAKRLVEAQQTAAMLTTFNEVDMSAIMDMRKRRRDSFQEQHGVKLGFMSFFTKASVGALKAFPWVNSELDGDELILKHYYDIGIAVGVEEGLVVPVLRDADRKSFAEIEHGIRELGTKARDNKLAIDELMGGTFTITNGGVFGSLLSTPILNVPQVAILGMHKIEERPMVVDGEIVVRPMMYLALSYDHRVVDGSGAVQFLVKIKELLEDPERLLLEG